MRTNLSLLLAAALAVGGCATMSQWRNLEAPQVEVAGIKVVGIGMTSGTFDVTLRVNNPNRVDLHGTSLNTTIDVNGARFAAVDLTRAFDLPKGSAVPIVVPVTVQWNGSNSVVRSIIGAGSVPYTLGGRIMVDTPIGPRALDFSASGNVSVLR